MYSIIPAISLLNVLGLSTDSMLSFPRSLIDTISPIYLKGLGLKALDINPLKYSGVLNEVEVSTYMYSTCNTV